MPQLCCLNIGTLAAKRGFADSVAHFGTIEGQAARRRTANTLMGSTSKVTSVVKSQTKTKPSMSPKKKRRVGGAAELAHTHVFDRSTETYREVDGMWFKHCACGFKVAFEKL